MTVSSSQRSGAFEAKSIGTSRHRTSWIEVGPPNGPLMIFLHGWPELSIVWRSQIEAFADRGWRCVAPDMRGYGGSSVPESVAAYSVRELTADMVELHDALGADPAIWIGHDWGSAVAWSMAAHHSDRCRGVANLCIPYLARGIALPTLEPLIDRTIYPSEQFPLGQWDYWQFYREEFRRAVADFETDVEATLTLLYRKASPDAVGIASPTATIRTNGGWFNGARKAPRMERDTSMLSPADFELVVSAFQKTGFRGASAWYLNDAENLAFAAEAPRFGTLELPALFLHAALDVACDTVHSRLANPMRSDCTNLTETTIDAGHEIMLEKPDELNAAIAQWLAKENLTPVQLHATAGHAKG
jgi:pimeloyl-ACP methyl ester carboxylesterase